MSNRQSFWRQSFILLTRCVGAVSAGAFFAHVPILESSIASGTDVEATSEQVSWIVTCLGIGGIFGICLDTTLWEYCGRRVFHFNASGLSFISWLTFYFANTIWSLMAATFIGGLAIGGLFSMPSMLSSEYTSPTRRGYFIAINELVVYLTLLSLHMLSLVSTRQDIAVLGLVSSALACILTCFWPESPYYLALQGKFEECIKTYIWLHGAQSGQDRELADMICKQTIIENETINLKGKMSIKNLKAHFTKDFVRALFIVGNLVIILDSSARIFFATYCYKIMRELFSSKSIAVYCTAAINGLQIISLLIVSFIIRLFSRRSILFGTGTAAVIVMYSMGVLYLAKPFFASELTFSVSIIACLLLQTFFVNVGVVPVSLTIISEIFPMKSKGLGSFLTGLFFTIVMSLNAKLAPTVMELTCIGTLYSVFATFLLLCFGILYKILPETKDKPLLLIEREIANAEPTMVELKPMLIVEK